MKNITVTYSTGDKIATSINGTVQTIMTYYLGKYFNIGTVSDKMARAVRIDFHN